MITRVGLALLLAGCASPPPLETAPFDFRPTLGGAANRLAGTVLTLEPTTVRLSDRARSQPEGFRLVARNPRTLRPTAVLRVQTTFDSIARVERLRGQPELGDEVVEPSGDLMLEANQLPVP